MRDRKFPYRWKHGSSLGDRREAYSAIFDSSFRLTEHLATAVHDTSITLVA
ncbi:MAG: hypothetical protein P1U77_22740 [Rubripirellula sp.]|nr:hypothetical protein [Planctomycetaceae bacterium]MDF1844265.1 hypothetical protein [Rubripirellula sp.]